MIVCFVLYREKLLDSFIPKQLDDRRIGDEIGKLTFLIKVFGGVPVLLLLIMFDEFTFPFLVLVDVVL